MIENSVYRVPSSFRDLSGFVYYKNGMLLRQINNSVADDYNDLMQSGLYDELVLKGYLLPHEEVSIEQSYNSEAMAVIQPDFVPFISYPYEWSFSQLKDAALTTINIQKIALDYNMSLKDASGFNIQFLQGSPILIDTLSFEKYKDGSPWIAYRQFCQHFLAPLALMALVDVRTQFLLRSYIDGLPLDLVSNLLPKKSYLNLGLLTHIHMHARMQNRYAKEYSTGGDLQNKMPKEKQRVLLDSLYNTVKALSWQSSGTEWAQYYNETNYSQKAFDNKHEFIKNSFLNISPKPKIVWDLGANNGEFSRFMNDYEVLSVAMDSDPAAVEQNYCLSKKEKNSFMLPLFMDLTNPSPALGWSSNERSSLLERGPADMVLALALVHHLSLSNNVPFYKLAEFFSQIGSWLVIEFIPKTDSQVKKLIHNRKDDLSWYNRHNFEKEFEKLFSVINKIKIKDSDRVIYFMKKNEKDS